MKAVLRDPRAVVSYGRRDGKPQRHSHSNPWDLGTHQVGRQRGIKVVAEIQVANQLRPRWGNYSGLPGGLSIITRAIKCGKGGSRVRARVMQLGKPPPVFAGSEDGGRGREQRCRQVPEGEGQEKDSPLEPPEGKAILPTPGLSFSDTHFGHLTSSHGAERLLRQRWEAAGRSVERL